eukprot:TRINITY_DN21870_c0_g1_i1.p1 TRINITY_DN21870_c0_g1~~TRINITY_DN21870_c0_g1_i1.p1  ORF type:complete len:390 (+),score=44.85 TRINITY_DN21870_c0_g1_i1:51-1220(+)
MLRPSVTRRRPPSAPSQSAARIVASDIAAVKSDVQKLKDEMQKVSGSKDDDEGFEDGEIIQDVYATAFLLAKNATEGMYSFWVWKNKQMRLLWAMLLFIIVSQMFALGTLTMVFPPTVESEAFLFDCEDADSLAQFHEIAGESANCTSYEPIFTLLGHKIRRLNMETYFYQNIFQSSSLYTIVLQIICSLWVLCCVYYRVHERVYDLMAYADFNEYFLPLKGEVVANKWAIGLPLLQWFFNTIVAAVSCTVICGYSDAVDIILNSLAFTFIAEVPEYFNEPLVKYYKKTAIHNTNEGGQMDVAVYGTAPIYYLYPDYSDDNYDPAGWYILERHQRFGMLSDYRYRHNPDKYTQKYVKITYPLKVLYWVVPIALTFYCWWFHTPGKPTIV